MRYKFVKAERKNYPVVTLCKIMRISTSAFYDWLKPSSSDREKENQLLRQKIARVFDVSRGTYGRRRIASAMEKMGQKASINRGEAHERT